MNELFLILDNLRSAQNVGSIIRTAESVGVTKIYLCGITPNINDPKVLKTSLGAEKTIEIRSAKNTLDLLKELIKQNVKIISLELSEKSRIYNEVRYTFPMALVVGNEVSGISEEILKLSDKIIEIPMRGKKNSLNVTVATGIAVYEITKTRCHPEESRDLSL